MASDADLTALEHATQPVYVELEQDGVTRALIEQIRELKQRLPAPASVEPCAPPTTATTVEQVVDTDSTDEAFPEGVYRMAITAESMVQLGVSEDDAETMAGCGR